jgi:uncharacterized protein (DUF433 family)
MSKIDHHKSLHQFIEEQYGPQGTPRRNRFEAGYRQFKLEQFGQFIELNPKIMIGKPAIKGTRITTEHILQTLSTGNSIDSILLAYPHLSREQVEAVVSFSGRAIPPSKS